jgi:Mn-dependent DtxR family transcriptional regulator
VSRLVEQGLAETARQKPIERTAEVDAEGIEHHISPETLEKLRAFAEERSAR